MLNTVAEMTKLQKENYQSKRDVDSTPLIEEWSGQIMIIIKEVVYHFGLQVTVLKTLQIQEAYSNESMNRDQAEDRTKTIFTELELKWQCILEQMPYKLSLTDAGQSDMNILKRYLSV